MLAPSFARSFFRNAINNGLPVVECDTSFVAGGIACRFRSMPASSPLEMSGAVSRCRAASMPVVLSLLEHGGLVPFLTDHSGWEQLRVTVNSGPLLMGGS